MNLIVKFLVALIAIEHIFILWVEMFAWTSVGKKIFNILPEDMFYKTKTLAANQGLYNGFLVAGLIWSIFINNVAWSNNVAIFFLSCVIVAGIYGAITATKSIFFKQALPAIAVMVVLFVSMV
jgi:putative membrane protein